MNLKQNNILLKPFRGFSPIRAMIVIVAAGLLSARPADGRGEGGYSADFSTAAGRSGWKAEGVVDRSPGADGWEFIGGEQVALFSPPGLPLEGGRDRVLTISLTIVSPRRAAIIWPGPGGEWAQLPIPILLESRRQEVMVNLGASPFWQGRIDRFILVFEGRPGSIVLSSLEIGPRSPGGYLRHQAAGLARRRTLNPGTINSLSSPPLFGKTLAYYLNLTAFWTVLVAGVGAIIISGPRRKRVAITAGVCLLAIWLLSDLRETWESARTAGQVYASHLRPPPGERTFPGLGDFYRFVEFCRDKIPPGSIFAPVPYPYWPFDVRLKNYLYPARMIEPLTQEYLSGVYPRYLIVYRRPEYVFDSDEGRIYHSRERRFVSGPGRFLARYDRSSFIFLEAAP